MRAIGFAGTAKNTGKTTAAATLLQAAYAAGLRPALTSIGYDGEAVDTVTALPKPRYHLPPDVLVATTDRCLAAGTAVCEVLQQTGIATILGEIVLARTVQPGQVLLAGPNRRTDLEAVLAAVSDLECDLTLVDGALNRLVPLSAAGGLVLSTGAAFDPDPERVARHAAALVRLFSLPVIQADADADYIRWVGRDGRAGSLHTGSLIGEESFQALKAQLPDWLWQITFPGACDPALLEALFYRCETAFPYAQIVFGHPANMVAGGDPLRWQSVIDRFEAAGATVAVFDRIPLRCLTVNPFYPHYSLQTGRYDPAFIDSTTLLNAVRAAVPDLPVVDVRQLDPNEFLALVANPTSEVDG